VVQPAERVRDGKNDAVTNQSKVRLLVSSAVTNFSGIIVRFFRERLLGFCE
jgi:hypothetical protein